MVSLGGGDGGDDARGSNAHSVKEKKSENVRSSLKHSDKRLPWTGFRVPVGLDRREMCTTTSSRYKRIAAGMSAQVVGREPERASIHPGLAIRNMKTISPV
jgi:hypothetical protein